MNDELQELIEYAESKGYKVSFVGKDTLKDYAGMNPEAGKLFGWEIAPNEYQISNELSEERQADDLRHEIIEDNLMKHGMKYAQAHDIGLRLEATSIMGKGLDTLGKLKTYDVVQVYEDGNIEFHKDGTEFVLTHRGDLIKSPRMNVEIEGRKRRWTNRTGKIRKENRKQPNLISGIR